MDINVARDSKSLDLVVVTPNSCCITLPFSTPHGIRRRKKYSIRKVMPNVQIRQKHIDSDYISNEQNLLSFLMKISLNLKSFSLKGLKCKAHPVNQGSYISYLAISVVTRSLSMVLYQNNIPLVLIFFILKTCPCERIQK